jgi:hypothetical protein
MRFTSRFILAFSFLSLLGSRLWVIASFEGVTYLSQKNQLNAIGKVQAISNIKDKWTGELRKSQVNSG